MSTLPPTSQPPTNGTATNGHKTPANDWTDQPSAPIKSAIVVGAGPSGLVLGILLAKAGIHVQMLEASHELDKNPRAAHYAPSACYDLNRAGVLDDVRKVGFQPDSVCWRDPKDLSVLGGIRSRNVDVDYPMVCLPLDRLDVLLLEHFERLPNTEILFNHKVLDLKQDDASASVHVEIGPKDQPSNEKKWMSADYVIGADGANSQIRRSLHGDLNYPGETLQHQIIATNVYYDFHKFGYWDSNFIIDPENWYMAAKITKDGLWRVTYGDVWGLSTEEYLERQPMRYEKILPGNPKPGDYKLVSASPYKLHQRCSPSMREGRICLVADAAHLCNPFGGMGLTGGFADVGSLYDAFMAIHKQNVPDTAILTEYSRARIQKWKEVIDPMSRKNFDLVWNPAPETVKAREEFFALTKKAETDLQLATMMAHSTHGLRENFDAFISQAYLGPDEKGPVDVHTQIKPVGAFNTTIAQEAAAA